MSEKIKLVRGDTRPQIQVAFTDQNTGEPVDITGCSVVMRFRAVGSSTVLSLVNGFVTDGVAGKAVVAWGQNTLDVPAGDYEGEVEVTFPDNGGVQTLFDLLKFKVREDF